MSINNSLTIQSGSNKSWTAVTGSTLSSDKQSLSFSVTNKPSSWFLVLNTTSYSQQKILAYIAELDGQYCMYSTYKIGSYTYIYPDLNPTYSYSNGVFTINTNGLTNFYNAATRYTLIYI